MARNFNFVEHFSGPAKSQIPLYYTVRAPLYLYYHWQCHPIYYEDNNMLLLADSKI